MAEKLNETKLLKTKRPNKSATKTPRPKENPMLTTHPTGGTAPAIDMLGSKLKAYYGEIVSEPIPDRLKALMAELEALSTAGSQPKQDPAKINSQNQPPVKFERGGEDT